MAKSKEKNTIPPVTEGPDIDIEYTPDLEFPEYPPPQPPVEPRPPAPVINIQAEKSIRNQTVVGSNSVIPIVYGHDRVFGQIIAVKMTQSYLYVAYAVSEGEIYGYDKTFVNGDNIATVSGVSKHTYNGTPSGNLDGWLDGVISGYNDYNPNTAYAVLRVAKDSISGFPRAEFVVWGRKVYDPRKDTTNGGSGTHRADTPSTWEYSANPTLCFADYITQFVGWDVDWPSIIDNANENDSLDTNGAAYRSMGMALLRPSKVSNWIKSFQEIMSAFVVWEAGKIRVIPDRADVTEAQWDAWDNSGAGDGPVPANLTAHLTVTEIKDKTFKLIHKGTNQSPTVVTVDYRDSSDDGWPQAFQTAEAAGVAGGTTPRRLSRINLPSVHTASQAKRIAVKRLNHYIADLSGSCVVFDEGIEYQIGSIIAITHPIGITRKLFRVMSLAAKGTDWSLTFEEYDPAAYSSEVVDAPTFPNTDLGNPLLIPDLTNLTLNESLFRSQNGTVSSRLRVAWTTDSNYAFFNEFRVRGYIPYRIQTNALTAHTVTTGNAGTLLVNSGAAFLDDYRIKAGDTVDNLTDGSVCEVVSVDSDTQITTTQLAGGSTNDWTIGDSYKISGLDKTFETKVKESPAFIPNVEQLVEDADDQVPYEVYVSGLTSFAGESNALTGGLTIEGKFAIPPAPPSLQVNQIDADKVRLDWAESIDIDIWKYEIRRSPIGTDDWEAATFVERVDSLTYLVTNLPLGGYRFYVKAIDSVKQYSTTYASGTVTLNAPPDVETIAGFEVSGEVRLQWPAVTEEDSFIKNYRVTYSTITDTDETDINLTDSLRLTTKEVPVGTWRFRVYARDTAGNESDSAPFVQMEVTLDSDVFIASEYDFFPAPVFPTEDSRSGLSGGTYTLDADGRLRTLTADADGSCTARTNYLLADLTDGKTYHARVTIHSITNLGAGAISIDWCDVGMQSGITAVGSYNLSASKADYTSTFRFMDFAIVGGNSGCEVVFEIEWLVEEPLTLTNASWYFTKHDGMTHIVSDYGEAFINALPSDFENHETESMIAAITDRDDTATTGNDSSEALTDTFDAALLLSATWIIDSTLIDFVVGSGKARLELSTDNSSWDVQESLIGQGEYRYARVRITGTTHNGTVSAASSTQLNDTGVTFVTDGIQIGDKITNLATGETVAVTAINSETQITHGTLTTAWVIGNTYKIQSAFHVKLPTLALRVNVITKSENGSEHTLSGGECTTANGGTSLINSNGAFATDNVNVGDVVVNLTDGSQAAVLSVTNDTTLVHEALSGGSENDWDVGDLYAIGTKIQLNSSFSTAKAISVTPNNPSGPCTFVVDDIQYGTPTSFLVYGFDWTGEEVSEPFLWNFEGV